MNQIFYLSKKKYSFSTAEDGCKKNIKEIFLLLERLKTNKL